MAGRTTDRKAKAKDSKSPGNDFSNALATFSLPDSLPCSEVNFPILLTRVTKANWEEILQESDEKLKDIEEYLNSKRPPPIKAPFLNTEGNYIREEVFTLLLPALEETLNKAKIWEALIRQKCFFNGIDHIVQVLWNNNPRHPSRKAKNLHLFNMPWVRKHLKENPRPYYPKSWLWPENYAATIIQKTVRQYFVQREEPVQEMREFWKKLVIERNTPEMSTNPLLQKRFAWVRDFCKQ